MYVCVCVVYIHLWCTYIVYVDIDNMHINALFTQHINKVMLPLLTLQNQALKNQMMSGQSRYVTLQSDMTKLCTKNHWAVPNMTQ